MVVAWQWVGPDHAEMTFAIGAHIHLVAFDWNSLHLGIVQVEQREKQSTFSCPTSLLQR